jgi:hypothetical protein
VDTTATTPDGPPARPDESASQLREERRWLPTIVVAAVIAVLVFGGYVAAAALSEPAGPPVSVGGVVTVQPLTGWQVVNTSEVGGLPTLRLTRGVGNLDVVAVVPYDGSARALADDYVNRVLSHQLTHLSVSGDLTSVPLREGLVGERFSYIGVTQTGSSIEGEVTAVVTTDDGVVFDGWAPQGLLTFVDGDIHTMIDRAVYP